MNIFKEIVMLSKLLKYNNSMYESDIKNGINRLSITTTELNMIYSDINLSFDCIRINTIEYTIFISSSNCITLYSTKQSKFFIRINLSGKCKLLSLYDIDSEKDKDYNIIKYICKRLDEYYLSNLK